MRKLSVLIWIGILGLVAGCARSAPGDIPMPTAPTMQAQAAIAAAPPATATAAAPSPVPPLATLEPTRAPALVTPVPAPVRPAEPLVPTVPASIGAIVPSGEMTTATPEAPAALALQPDEPSLVPANLHSRLGVGWANAVPQDAAIVERLGFGWYLDWTVQPEPLRMPGLEFAQMVLTRDSTPFWRQRDRIAQAVKANPGALWLIGNEQDVPWQDNQTPEAYARRYHQFYIYIKSLDPTAQVAIGGVSQPTPLRLLYLDRILAVYEQLYGQPMPVDVWNVHAFVLREERDSWGVSIPPGFDEVDQGMLYEIEDHDDLEIFRQQLVDFRRWMARHGWRDKPLIVTEYGILMPETYGFPPHAVIDFMESSFDFLLEARDSEIGYPLDDNRLVQRLTWFSVGDSTYPTGNLVDPTTGALTSVGQAFANYAARLAPVGD